MALGTHQSRCLGCLGPWMSTGIIMNFRFMHNQGGRLYKHRVTGQVLWLLLCSPKGLMPSALRPNHTLLASSANSFPYFLSIFLHCDPSAGTLNFPSFLRSSLCHRIALACSLFWNKRFNHGIIGAYHITFAGTLFLGGSPSTSPGSLKGNATENKNFPTYAPAQDHYGDCIHGLIFLVTDS